MKLRNFYRGRQLYSAGRPSRWTSACILLVLWPPYGMEQAIIFSSCRLFYHLSSFFFPRLISVVASQIGCLPYFHIWCGISANLRCRSQTCCTRLADNTGRKISPKIRHLRTIARLCRAVSSQLRHVSIIGKTIVKR